MAVLVLTIVPSLSYLSINSKAYSLSSSDSGSISSAILILLSINSSSGKISLKIFLLSSKSNPYKFSALINSSETVEIPSKTLSPGRW